MREKEFDTEYGKMQGYDDGRVRSCALGASYFKCFL